MMNQEKSPARHRRWHRPKPDSIAVQRSQLQSIFRVLGASDLVESVAIPDAGPRFPVMVVVPAGLSYAQLCRHMSAELPVTGDGLATLDTELTDDRVPEQAYAIRLRQRVEADVEYENMSAAVVRRQGIAGVTLREQLLHAWLRFRLTGRYLDADCCTLCSGSVFTDGTVPLVYWESQKRQFCIDRCPPERAEPGLRTRLVIT